MTTEHILVHVSYAAVGLLIGYWISNWQLNKTIDKCIQKKLKEAGLK